MNKNFNLHSGTCFKKIELGKGITEEWHKDQETGETVILHSWWVSDGDCVSGEFEVVEVIPAGGLVGQLKRLLGIN